MVPCVVLIDWFTVNQVGLVLNQDLLLRSVNTVLACVMEEAWLGVASHTAGPLLLLRAYVRRHNKQVIFWRLLGQWLLLLPDHLSALNSVKGIISKHLVCIYGVLTGYRVYPTVEDFKSILERVWFNLACFELSKRWLSGFLVTRLVPVVELRRDVVWLWLLLNKNRWRLLVRHQLLLPWLFWLSSWKLVLTYLRLDLLKILLYLKSDLLGRFGWWLLA